MDFAITIPNAVLVLHQFTSKDDYRRNLQHVQIEFGGGSRNATAVASDGHRLIKVDFRLPEEDECPLDDTTILVKGNDLKEIARTARKGSAVLECRGDREGICRWHVGSTHGDTVLGKDLQFPNYRQITSNPDRKGKATLSELNPKYLAEMLRHATNVPGKGTPLGVRFLAQTDSEEPILFTLEDIESKITCTYLLMPMRM